MATIIRHMSVSIEGLIKNTGRKSMKGFFSDDSGKDISDKEARAYLKECIAKGWKRLPFGDCEGFDYVKGCPGHVKDNVTDKQ